MKKAVNLESVQGGSESKVKKGIAKLKGVTQSKDPNYLKRDMFIYTGDTKLPDNLPDVIREAVKGDKKADIDVVDEDKIKFEKVSHMG